MLTIALSALLAANPVEVVPACTIDRSMVFVHAAISIESVPRTSKGSRQLVHLACFRDTKACSGAILDLDAVTQGTLTVGEFNLQTFSDAVLTSVSGTTAVVTWGIHVFVIDLVAGTLSKSAESLSGTGAEHGVGRCPRTPRSK